MKQMFPVLAAVFLLLAGSSPAGAAASTVVTGLRYSSSEGHTRLVIESRSPAPFSHETLDNPPRIVIDITGSPAPGLEPLIINDGIVSRVRIGYYSGKARFVLDAVGFKDYRVFEVPAEGDLPHRYVVDVFGGPPPKAPAPVPDLPVQRSPTVKAPPPRSGPYIVVVDAGHGGQDPGARGFSLNEKDVCLDVARGVAAELNSRPGFKAYLTRDSDVFIPLRGRSRIAEQKNADVFVSIHANASKSSTAHGTEVYFLSLSGATDEASRELAQLENSADLMGGVAPEADDDVSGILFDMQQTDMLARGSLLAESVVNALRTYSVLKTRGVKQAGFVVLKSPRIPSILVETAFITNPAENKRLASESFRNAFSKRVADGIVRYFEASSVAELR